MSVKTCPTCKGDTKCKSCHGTGQKSHPNFLNLNSVECKKCDGTGNCTRCDGNGVVPKD